MKKTLQLERAFRAALIVLLLGVAGTTNGFAQRQMATLQHGDEISAYYGVNAFVEALGLAEDSDIITLSSGDFNAANITKAITIRGAGVIADTLTLLTPTYVLGGFILDIPNDSVPLVVEGICFENEIVYEHDLYHASFIKCNIKKIRNNGATTNIGFLYDVNFIDCLIENTNISSSRYSDGVQFINSVVGLLCYEHSNYARGIVNIYNSIVTLAIYQSYNEPEKFHIYNSIISNNSEYYLNDSFAYNSIEIGSVFSNSVQTNNCMQANEFSDVFVNYDGTFSFDADFSVKDDIATNFLGDDGTQVGIFGGAMPYNSSPSYLIPSRCTVAPQSTSDGKLNVEIEIVTEE